MCLGGFDECSLEHAACFANFQTFISCSLKWKPISGIILPHTSGFVRARYGKSPTRLANCGMTEILQG